MPPRGPTKSRDFDYSNVGKAGRYVLVFTRSKLFFQLMNARKSRKYSPSLFFFIRRTGITLREGKLDEHGMEEIEGIFSSPEKSPVKVNGHGYGNDTLNSEDMETGDSTFLHCHHMGPIILVTQNGISYTHFPSR